MSDEAQTSEEWLSRDAKAKLGDLLNNLQSPDAEPILITINGKPRVAVSTLQGLDPELAKQLSAQGVRILSKDMRERWNATLGRIMYYRDVVYIKTSQNKHRVYFYQNPDPSTWPEGFKENMLKGADLNEAVPVQNDRVEGLVSTSLSNEVLKVLQEHLPSLPKIHEKMESIEEILHKHLVASKPVEGE